ncbi:hypothetical protein CSA08_02490 [Candidatus Gracilibacteria bacterium]|nr:MAG: hypothetical protein CSA08_02490 [Candidatus Gracilibacteria bacterium]
MIKKIKLVNFRNFGEKDLDFVEGKNFIIGENGKGKTNILECISILGNNSLLSIHYENLVKKNNDFFYVEYENGSYEKISISFDKEKNKKVFSLNGKTLTKTKFKQNTYKCVIFSPIIMNIMYLSPSLRRDFIDNILISSYPNYEKVLKQYKVIVQSRNKILKNIFNGKSKKEELEFWDDLFTKKAVEVYNYRFIIIDFLSKNIKDSIKIFGNKVNTIKFEYKTKVNRENIETYIKEYLNKNIERDIILKKTNIGPHIDDFDILIDNAPLTNFASRGETKSIILDLKILEISFIENITKQKPILIIDDLLSELDDYHRDNLLNKIKHYQTFISLINNVGKNKLENKYHYL